MRRKVTISDLVLLVLEKTIDGYVRFEHFTYHPLWTGPIKKSSLAVALKRLREQGYIDLESYNTDLVCKLTNKGKSEAVLRRILIEDKWDGKWRLAIFDIPEKHRKARNVLRSRLKTWGFVQWQKSVWATKKDITKELRKFVKEAGVEEWVLVIESENVEGLTT